MVSSSSSVMGDHERGLGQLNAVALAADLCPVLMAVQGQAEVQSAAAPSGADADGLHQFPNTL